VSKQTGRPNTHKEAKSLRKREGKAGLSKAMGREKSLRPEQSTEMRA